jgi:hypothetical protein
MRGSGGGWGRGGVIQSKKAVNGGGEEGGCWHQQVTECAPRDVGIGERVLLLINRYRRMCSLWEGLFV